MGGIQTPALARLEQEIPVSEAAKRGNSKLKLSRRKPKTINKTVRRKTETPNNEESLDPAAGSDQSVGQNQLVHNHAVEESAPDTEDHPGVE